MNSQFLTRLLTSGKKDFERVSVVKKDVSSTACELIMLILSISVTLKVTCLTVALFIMKSCSNIDQHIRDHFKGSALADFGSDGIF